MDFRYGYREVVVNKTLPEKFKEIPISIGGTQSTLQDIQVPERSGAYRYKDSSKCYTRNRFIYWRVHHDSLELEEHSLDLNLISNNVVYKFNDTPVLDGISIYETHNTVIILVPTVSSVHRLVFPHPDNSYRQEFYYGPLDASAKSIFADANVTAARSPESYHVITSVSTNTNLPHTAASCLSVGNRDEALFALAYNTGNILLVRMDPVTGFTGLSELKTDGLIPRYFFRLSFGVKANDGLVAVSMALHTLHLETYLFCLCRDGHLRMWSCSKIQCIASIDLLDKSDSSAKKPENYLLRKAEVSSDADFTLCAYLCNSSVSEFRIVKPVEDNGVFKFSKVITRYAPKHDLVDFCLDENRIWAIFMATTGEAIVSSIKHNDISWEPVVLEQSFEQDEFEVSDSNPKLAYMFHIFRESRFSLQTIGRALNLYRRTNYEVPNMEDTVKEEVASAVENEIQNEMQQYDLSDRDIIEIAERCWSRFYSCCVQYHQSAIRPIGISPINASGVLLIKKQQFSVLRPMDVMEYLLWTDINMCNPRQFESANPFRDEQFAVNGINVMSAISTLQNAIHKNTHESFKKNMYNMKPPDIIAKEIVDDLERKSDVVNERFLTDLQQKLEHTGDAFMGIEIVLDELALHKSYYVHAFQLEGIVNENPGLAIPLNRLYRSDLGMSIITESLYQIACTRFAVCRNLLVLQQLLIKYSRSLCSKLQPCQYVALSSDTVPQTATLAQAYNSIIWACEKEAYIGLNDSSVEQLTGLQLSECAVARHRLFPRVRTLVEVFLDNCGADYIARELQRTPGLDESTLPQWHCSLLKTINILARVIWPLEGLMLFPEFLLRSGQYKQAQEYSWLLNSWCDSNISCRNFLLGVALLATKQLLKASQIFLLAARDVKSHPYFSSKILEVNPEEYLENDLYLLYYFKVISMFEHIKHSESVIDISKIAISFCKRNGPEHSTLLCKIFTNYLQLGRYEEAYRALVTNPDAARRKDCLRELVVKLFECRRFDTLMEFPYVGMVEDLERIVESHARSMDILTGRYYNFLYSFHVKRNNHRKAATVMYEQGLRLGKISTGDEEVLKKQASCYVACVNSLRLVDKKYAFIVKPVRVTDFENESFDSSVSMGRSENGESPHHNVKMQVEVLEIPDIYRECELVNARLQLVKHSPAHATTGCRLNAGELVPVLTNVGLYRTALKLCTLYKISYDIVFEGLATMCAKLNIDGDDSSWIWLFKNDIGDLPVGNGPAKNAAWLLLETLLMEYEEPKLSTLHKVVTAQLCSLGVFLPLWLEISYKKRNPAEYLRLLLSSGRVADAEKVAVGYIWAVLGRDTESYGNMVPLSPCGPQTYLPHHTIELLLLELNSARKDDESYEELYVELSELYDHYLETLAQVEKEHCAMYTQMKNQIMSE